MSLLREKKSRQIDLPKRHSWRILSGLTLGEIAELASGLRTASKSLIGNYLGLLSDANYAAMLGSANQEAWGQQTECRAKPAQKAKKTALRPTAFA